MCVLLSLLCPCKSLAALLCHPTYLHKIDHHQWRLFCKSDPTCLNSSYLKKQIFEKLCTNYCSSRVSIAIPGFPQSDHTVSKLSVDASYYLGLQGLQQTPAKRRLYVKLKSILIPHYSFILFAYKQAKECINLGNSMIFKIHVCTL